MRFEAELRLRDAEERLREFGKGKYWVEGGERVERYEGDLQGWKDVSAGKLSYAVRGYTDNEELTTRPRYRFASSANGNRAANRESK